MEPLFEHDESDFDCELMPAEIEALGDLAGLRVLHLVSGMPFESLALGALGASVLAMNAGESDQDYVGLNIEMGNSLAAERELDVTFIAETLAGLHDSERDSQFDIVYAGPTTLAWTDNLPDWAVDVSEALLPGGALVMYDEHPASRALEPDDWAAEGEEPIGSPEEEAEKAEKVAEDVEAGAPPPAFDYEPVDEEWTLDELVAALEGQGLVIARLDEIFGPQRFLTTADAVDDDTGLPTAFVLVAERPATE